MRRVTIALLTITVLFASSCGGGELDEVVTRSEIPAPSTTAGRDVSPDDTASDLVSDSAGPETSAASGEDPSSSKEAVAGSNKALVLAAVEKSASAHDSVRMAMTMVVGGVPELGGGEAALLIEAAVADGGMRSEFSMDMSGFLDAALAAPDLDPVEVELMRSWFDQPLEFRVIDGTTYMSASLLAFFVPAETTWVAFETEQPIGDLGLSEMTAAPADFLALLRGIDDDAEIVGSEVIDGVSTTHIRGSLSVGEAVAAAPEADRAAVQASISGLDPSGLFDASIELFDIDVWMDDDGLVHRVVLAVDDLAAMDETGETPEGAYLRFVLEFSDYGADVIVEEPAATDVTFIDASTFGFGG